MQSIGAFDFEESVNVLVRDLVEGGGCPGWGLGRFGNETGGDAVDEVWVGHEVAGDVVFALEGFGNGPSFAQAHLSQGDFEAGGASFGEGLEGAGGPFGLGFFGFERFDDGFYAAVFEASIDCHSQLAG